MKSGRYPACILAAMACLLLIGGCSTPRKHVPITSEQAKHGRFAPQPQMTGRISDLMRLAEIPDRLDEALQGLLDIQLHSASPLSEEAAFRRAQLMLRHDYPDAMDTARTLLTRYPDHALAPYANFWLAELANRRGDQAMVFRYTLAALQHRRLTAEVAAQAIALGVTAAEEAEEWQAVQWFFSVADADLTHAQGWLLKAAERSSLSTINRLHDAGRLTGSNGRIFLQNAARFRLRTGDMEEVRAIARILSVEAPGSREFSRVQNWASGNIEQASIGILLPLSGPYARFGEQALRGIRLAVDSIQQNSQVSIFIEDTGGQPERCNGAYRALLEQGVDMIIGPLLATCVEKLSPDLSSTVPVMTLTNREGLASKSPWLFAHSLSQTLQAGFMARYAAGRGATRLVVIHSLQPSSQKEAAAFSEMFEGLGGEVVYDLELPGGTIDYRNALRGMRQATDDEALLARLDEKRALFGDPEEEIRLPVNFDGVYLALPGKVVSLLAGQLAYLGVVRVPLFGSSRWKDGFLLLDRGRYLSMARFSNTDFPLGHDPELKHLLIRYRELWGEDIPTKLLGLAYDSTLIVAMLTSRLGLKGYDVVRGLQDDAGFSGVTGHVRFNRDGIGQKAFKLFAIKHGEIVPAGQPAYLPKVDETP